MSDDKKNDEIYDTLTEEESREEELHKARKARAEKMREEKQRSMQIRRYGAIGAAVAISVIVLIAVVVKQKNKVNPRAIEPQTENVTLINADPGEILAERGGRERIVPASMTKVMTVLVAAEHISEDQLDDKVKLTKEVADYSYVNDCSNTGFELDEPITVRDLFYGTILPSGADSAVSLANYVAGSHEAFVDMMNEKLDELGLSETSHFTNCVGLYDENHYTTPYDMAVILKAATDNEWCRQVLSEHIYTTEKTKQHPDGLRISNLFLRRIEDKETHSTVLCAKTGFVSQSGSCAASMAIDKNGTEYLVVTAGSTSSWRCIYDHADIYTQFLPE